MPRLLANEGDVNHGGWICVGLFLKYRIEKYVQDKQGFSLNLV